MAWPKNRTEFGPNRTPVLFGLSDANEEDLIPVAVDPTSGAILTTSSGGGGGGTSSTFGAAFPTVGTAVGASNGTNMEPLNVDGSGNLKVNLETSLPAGTNAIGSITNTTFGATQSGVWNVTNISGTISLPSGAATSANQTNGAQQTNITDGTNIANVLAPGTPNSTGNAALTAITSSNSVAFSSTITTGTAALATTDAGNYNIVAVQLFQLGTGGSSIAFQGSNDNTNWYSVPLNRQSVSLATPFFSTTAADMYAGPLPYRYFRLQLSGQTGGTTSGTVVFKTGNYSVMTIGGQIAINGTQAISGNVGSAYATASTAPNAAFPMGGVDNSGNLQNLRLADTGDGVSTKILDVQGMLYNGTTWDRARSVQGVADTVAGVGLAATGNYIFNGANWEKMRGDLGDGSSPTGLLVNNPLLYNGSTYDRIRSGGVGGMAGVSLQASPSGGYTYRNLLANGTTTIKSGSGTLHTVTINNAGATDTVSIFDNTAGSGTSIAVIGSSSEATFTYDAAFTTGLTVVIAGTTSPNVTFTYK